MWSLMLLECTVDRRILDRSRNSSKRRLIFTLPAQTGSSFDLLEENFNNSANTYAW